MNLKKSFLKYCEDKELEINENQIDIVLKLNEYYNLNFNRSLIEKIFKDKKKKIRFLFSWRCWCREDHDFKLFF
tara:strand:- start:369 stop:590 length:222 start_codon:yes stop_codon:yes gene_type:complete